MPASEHLRKDQFRGPQRLSTEYGESVYTSHGSEHGILARLDDGTEIGRLVWNSSEIGDVEVSEEHRRQGVASGMLEHARLLAELNRRIPQPKHSDDRTDDGDAWARSAGGRLPRRRQEEEPSFRFQISYDPRYYNPDGTLR